MIAEIDQGVLADQYREIQMEAFKVRMELQMMRLKERHASGAEHAALEQALAFQEERLALLEETTARTREELLHRTMERVELELRLDHPEHDGRGGFEGRWSGRGGPDRELIHLTIRGEHARVETEPGGEWFETEFSADPRDDGLWNVAFRIVECLDEDYRGKTSLGLAKLDDERLVLALGEPGTDARPRSLEPGGEETDVLYFERR